LRGKLLHFPAAAGRSRLKVFPETSTLLSHVGTAS
jgi:hypothetical protein